MSSTQFSVSIPNTINAQRALHKRLSIAGATWRLVDSDAVSRKLLINCVGLEQYILGVADGLWAIAEIEGETGRWRAPAADRGEVGEVV